jgi:uncharacterized integral membrane protein
MPSQAKAILVGVLALVILILIAQNTDVVAVRLLFWEIQMSRVVLILLAAAVGFAGGYAVGRLRVGERKAGRS